MKNKITQVSKEIHLTSGERSVMRAHIQQHISHTKNSHLVKSPFGSVYFILNKRVLAGALVCVLTIGSSAQVTRAAQYALPGDSLYGMKRVTEQVHTATTFSESGKIKRAGEHAVRRLHERAVLQKEGGLTDAIVTDLSTSLALQVKTLAAHADAEISSPESVTESARALASIAGYANAISASEDIPGDEEASAEQITRTVSEKEESVDAMTESIHSFVASEEYVLAAKLEYLPKESVDALVRVESSKAITKAETSQDTITAVIVEAYSTARGESADEPLDGSLRALGTLTHIAEANALREVSEDVALREARED
ncbi:MAG: DUF5667 domain-containing protein [Minisyncoccia bacterium]